MSRKTREKKIQEATNEIFERRTNMKTGYNWSYPPKNAFVNPNNSTSYVNSSVSVASKEIVKVNETKYESPVIPKSQLKFTPYAWAKMIFMRDKGDTEVGAFGISDPNDPLLIVDIKLVPQKCSSAYVEFEDTGVADFFEDCFDAGLALTQYGRIWIHTHPSGVHSPSGTDENTFYKCFGRCDWAVMYILSKDGHDFCALQYNTKPGCRVELKDTTIDYSSDFPQSDRNAWKEEYDRCVQKNICNSAVSYGNVWNGDDYSYYGYGAGYQGSGVNQESSKENNSSKEYYKVLRKPTPEEDPSNHWSLPKENCIGKVLEKAAVQGFSYINKDVDKYISLNIYENEKSGWAFPIACVEKVDAPPAKDRFFRLVREPNEGEDPKRHWYSFLRSYIGKVIKAGRTRYSADPDEGYIHLSATDSYSTQFPLCCLEEVNEKGESLIQDIKTEPMLSKELENLTCEAVIDLVVEKVGVI